MTSSFKILLFFVISLFAQSVYSQTIVEDYQPIKNDSLRIGPGDKDFLPYIQSGYTLMLPESNTAKGVLIFLEDSGIDKKNRNAKLLYELASDKDFAVLSVSTEIPLDFFFTEASMQSVHQTIKSAFKTHALPNENIFFLGPSLVGHRALRYIKYVNEGDFDFQLNIKGIVPCNFTMDWTRKWYQHQRDIKLNRIDLWEPKFMNYMLETYLDGTPETAPERYHDFSSYSYFDAINDNIDHFKNFAVRAYVEPAINYRLKTYYRTLYDNNAPDMVGFIAELNLRGNDNTELIVIQPEDKPSKAKTAQSTWNGINKVELMDWIQKQTEK
ncbi:hypothetical protein [Winogradskyella tangerina]|uniref:hypothetical protein n=1 Tax=Winogradskyella tangerina TaxID=2023240 RepID=UPI000DBE3C0D|nr:hypothetical protein [Winogradskyella tangerina]